ncbi:MAG: type II CAAX prenyl endopeptidase Rce1 family protein [Candidatus Hodarchaeota archaeon]
MSYKDINIWNRIKNSIIYNSIILLIFGFWFSYSIFNNLSILFIISIVIFLIVYIKFTIDRRHGISSKEKIVNILLFFIPFSLFVNIILLYNTSSPFFFIPLYSLVGMQHNHNFLLFLPYLSVILLRLLAIKIYFTKNVKILEAGRGDGLFQYFTRDLNYKKILLLVILFPLVALIEELFYRSFLLSVLTYSLNWDLILSIIFISIIFGLVHYSTSQNWGHVLSTFISSIIYSLALIQLGLIYPWILHLTTNLFVLLFYYQGKNKIRVMQELSNKS